MRKTICAWLCAALILGAAAVAEVPPEIGDEATLAEPAARAVAFSEADAGYAGTWVPFEDGFRLYLPSRWSAFDITDEQAGAGLFYRAGNGGGDDIVGEVAMGVAVSYVSAGKLKTLEDLEADFVGAGFIGLEQLNLNGIDAIGFVRPEDAYRGVAFYHPDYPEYVLTVYVTPLDTEDSPADILGDAILSSLSPWPEPME